MARCAEGVGGVRLEGLERSCLRPRPGERTRQRGSSSPSRLRGQASIAARPRECMGLPASARARADPTGAPGCNAGAVPDRDWRPLHFAIRERN